jgi:hypothetical protein
MGHQSLQYIPGNMLLGAFASVWLARNKPACRPADDNTFRPDDDDTFRRLFLSGDVEWGHAYPSLGGRACVPVPRSYFRLKAKPPATDGEGKKALPVINMLREELSERSTFYTVLGIKDAHPKLKKLHIPFMDRETLHIPDLRVEWNMHAAISEERRAAAQSQLFGYQAIAAQREFISQIHCSSEQAWETVRELIEEAEHIRVGHSRSAGYGRVTVESIDTPPESSDSSGASYESDDCCTLFLLSDYLAAHPWKTPLQGILDELGGCFEELSEESIVTPYCEYSEIAGFHNLWRLPRTTCPALAKGSVLVIKAKRKRDVPLPATIGSRRTEGYGRLLWNPPFLQQATCIMQSDTPPAGQSQSETLAYDAIPKVLRSRALERQAVERALEAVNDEKWKKFIKTAAKSGLSRNQRGNIRGMVTLNEQASWAEGFKNLGATAKKRWDEVDAYSPFKGYNDHLHPIMEELLRNNFPQNKTVSQYVDALLLPGNAPSEHERSEFAKKFHREFLLALLQAWEKEERGNTGVAS